MYKSENTGALSSALSATQSKIKGAKKDSLNPHFRSAYSDLASVWEACRDALTSNDLSIAQTIHKDESGLYLKTTLTHKSGQWISSDIPILASLGSGRQDMQALGSAITYARRYGLAALVGVCPSDDDDDGEAAMGRVPPPMKPQAPIPRPVEKKELPPPPPIKEEVISLSAEVVNMIGKLTSKFQNTKLLKEIYVDLGIKTKSDINTVSDATKKEWLKYLRELETKQSK